MPIATPQISGAVIKQNGATLKRCVNEALFEALFQWSSNLFVVL